MPSGTTNFLFCLYHPKLGLKPTAKYVYSSLHLSQVIKFMTFLLLQERSPSIKYVILLTLDDSVISATKKCFQMSQELHVVMIFTWLLTDS